MSLFAYDEQMRNDHDCTVLCGVDEAGRGPLAGPVYAAAVIFTPDTVIEGINDSKKLTEKKRELLYDQIIDHAQSFCIATASEQEIDELNILGASMLAMRRAVEGLQIKPQLALIDGNKTPTLVCPAIAVVKGDATSASIAAASILAKVARDRKMLELDSVYPAYQFAKHKGYPTKLHYQMLDTYGPCEIHRMSFLKNYTRGDHHAGK